MTTLSHDIARKLHPDVRKLWRINNFISGLFWAALFVGGGFATERMLKSELQLKFPFLLVGLILALVIFLLGQLYVETGYNNWRFGIMPDEIRVEHGVMWKSAKSIPRQRIQHIDVTSGPWQRKFGISELHVYTAADHTRIPGIPTADAEQLRKELLGKDEL
ncbi:MAG: PH domain-containing protein [Fimbriimonadaceae bacterium]